MASTWSPRARKAADERGPEAASAPVTSTRRDVPRAAPVTAYFFSSSLAMTPRCTSSGPSASRSDRALSPGRREREVVGQAAAAVQLHRHVDDLLGHPGHRDLDLADLGQRAPRALGVELPGRVQHQQPGLVDGDPGVGDPLGVAAELGERPAERGARGGPLGRRARGPFSASPTSRMQWCTRPGPSRPWAISKARPGPSRTFDAGTRTSSKETSPWPSGSSYIPIAGSIRSTLTPGVSRGTSTIVCRECRSASGSESPMNTRILQSGLPTPVDHHLRPLTTTSSPSTTAVAAMLVASEEATSGSVIVNAQRIRPSSSGSSHCALLLVGAVLQQHLHVAGVGGVAVEHQRGEGERPVSSATGA